MANLPEARLLPKHDLATTTWRTPALFVKFFPYTLQERASVEAEIASGGLHENIIPALLMTGVDDGLVLIYPFVSGETLKGPEARERFYALPPAERRAALKTVLETFVALTEQGWLLVDFHEGNLIYDYENQKIWLFDWDLCVKAESYTLTMERNWGSSRLMAPEEFVRGATIDARTNVFNLGRLALLTLGNDATEQEKATLAKATHPERSERPPSVTALATALGI